MEKNTDEYNSLTKLLDQGNWYLDDKSVVGVQDMPGTSYTIDRHFTWAKVDFNFDARTSVFLFEVKRSYISEKLIDWKKKWPDLNVERYSVEITSEWKINEDGDILYIDDPGVDILIEGSGENFEGFYSWERTKFEMSKASSEGGGILGFAASLATKSASKTSQLFVSVGGQYNFDMINAGKVILNKPLSDDNLILINRE